MQYSVLVGVYGRLEATSKRLEKTFILSEFLKSAAKTEEPKKSKLKKALKYTAAVAVPAAATVGALKLIGGEKGIKGGAKGVKGGVGYVSGAKGRRIAAAREAAQVLGGRAKAQAKEYIAEAKGKAQETGKKVEQARGARRLRRQGAVFV